MLRRFALAQMLLIGAFAQINGASLDDMLVVQQLGSQIQGASVQLEIELRNISAKEITACDGFFLVRYADGKEAKPHWGIDLLGSMALVEVFGISSEGLTLKPGQRLSQKWPVPRGAGGGAPVSITPYLTMLIFADRTALGDPKQIKFMLRARARQAEETADVVAEARTLLNAPLPVAAIAGRIAKLKSEAEVATKASSASRPLLDRKARDLQSLYTALQGQGRAGGEKVLASWEARLKMLLEQATLDEGGSRE